MDHKKLRSVIVSVGTLICSIQDCFCGFSEFPQHGYTMFHFHNQTVKVSVDIRIVSVDDSKDVVVVDGWDYDLKNKIRIELYE